MNFLRSRCPDRTACGLRREGTRAVAILLTAALVLGGCARIATSSDQSYRTISDNTKRANYGPWKTEARAEVRAGAALLQISASRECDVHVDVVGERTTTTRRENQNVRGTYLAAIVGLAGASILAWSLDQHLSNDKALTTSGDDGKKTLSGYGYGVYLGSIASLGLLVVPDAAIRSWDTSSTEEQHEISDQRTTCEQRPLAGARLEVLLDDHVLAEGTTDREGKLALSCLPEYLELAIHRPALRLNGTPLPQSALQAHYLFADANVSGTSTSASLGPTAPPLAGPATRRLEIYGAALARARREELARVVRGAGGKLVEEHPHTLLFDVGSPVWPHAQQLKLLFDGHGLFIRAKWEGDFSGAHQTELLRALAGRYGVPARLEDADGTVTLRWPFEDGLELHYSRKARAGSSCPVAELTYVDPVSYERFEAAVRSVER